jgi:general stress protein YciG
MAYARLDDGFWMHPKIIMCGNTAAGIFARLLSYCGRYLTEGLIPRDIVNMIAGQDKHHVKELERVGLVQILESGGVLIPDYLDYNRTKAQVEADRQQRSEAGRRGGLKSRPRSSA